MPPKKKSNNNQTKTPTVVKAKQVTFKGPLSMEPTKFIAEIWDEFIETLGENGDKDIRKFLSQPKVLNRLAANRNKKMQEYFKKKAEKGLADNKIIQKYKSSENLNNDEISDIFNERVEELGFSEKNQLVSSMTTPVCSLVYMIIKTTKFFFIRGTLRMI